MRDLLLLIESSGPLTHVGLAAWQDGYWEAVAEAPTIGSEAARDQAPMDHTALLLPLIRQVLATRIPDSLEKGPSSDAEMSKDQSSSEHTDLQRQAFSRLAAVGVSSGPGSYTALRAGMSSAKGLCLALNVPLMKCDTLRGLAMRALALQSSSTHPNATILEDHNSPGVPRRIAALLFARRDEVYYGVYERDGSLVHPPSVARLTAEWVRSLCEIFVDLICGPDQEVLTRFCESVTPDTNRTVQSELVPLSANNLLSECTIRMQSKNFDVLATVTPDYLRAPFITQPRIRV